MTFFWTLDGQGNGIDDLPSTPLVGVRGPNRPRL